MVSHHHAPPGETTGNSRSGESVTAPRSGSPTSDGPASGTCAPLPDGSNVFLLHGGQATLRLARAAEEFDKIGWRFTPWLSKTKQKVLEGMAREYPYFASVAGKTSSGGSNDSRLMTSAVSAVGLSHLAVLTLAAAPNASDCTFIFEDDVVFHPNFANLFHEYWLRRDRTADVWQLGSFTNDLSDHPRDGRAGWVDGFQVGSHAYCVAKQGAADLLAMAKLERAPLEHSAPPRPIDVWIEHAGAPKQRLVDAPPPGIGYGNSMGIAYQAPLCGAGAPRCFRPSW